MDRQRIALEWIRDNAKNEEACDARCVCDNPFHTTHQSTGEPRTRCPDCFSSWWATDGTLPSESAAYACEAVASQALAEKSA